MAKKPTTPKAQAGTKSPPRTKTQKAKSSAKPQPPEAPKDPTRPRTQPPDFDPINVLEEDEYGENPFDRLSDRQIIFCNRYVIHWNGSKAAREAGYKDPNHSGWENRQKPAIQKYIRRKIEERCMSADEVLVHLSDIARGKHQEFWKFFDATLKEVELEEEVLDGKLDGELNSRTYEENIGETLRRVTPYLDVQGMVECGFGHLIKEYDVEHGQIKNVKFHDRMAALQLIGRYHKMFTDKIEATVNPDTPIQNDDLNPLADLGRDEINRRIADKLKPPTSRR